MMPGFSGHNLVPSFSHHCEVVVIGALPHLSLLTKMAWIAAYQK
jgi:hypothetical protein